jgi:hypothetical protein
MDGEDMAFEAYPFLPTVVLPSSPQWSVLTSLGVLQGNQCYYVVITTNISVNRMAREPERNMEMNS